MKTITTKRVALIIEADKTNLEYIADILEHSGFGVLKVNQIYKAKGPIQKLQQLDLVVINLEPWDNFVILFLETVRKKKPIPFTVLTTSKCKDEIPLHLRKKADMVVCKPFDCMHLVDELKRIFED